MLSMKTRSKFGAESISPVLKCKQLKSSRSETLSGQNTDAAGYSFKGPQSINRTPKLSKKRDIKSKTPSRDDVLCSQHFDSQTVVGWDCNSPGSVKSLTEKKILGEENDGVEDLVLKLIGKEPEENIIPNRSTPPLLGLWREKPKENQRCTTGIHQRLRKRAGRQRKKSAISAVSHELLEQLTVALNKCSDVDKETEGRNAEGELFLSDIKELDDLDENENTRVLQNVSSDLFESFKEETVDAVKQKAKCSAIKAGGDLAVNKSKPALANVSKELDDTTWSDDELFGNDSFIIHATQVTSSTNQKYFSPALKRKANDKELPQSKCTRYALSVSKGSTGKKSSVSECNLRNYTALVSRQNNSIPLKTEEICDGKTSRFADQSQLATNSKIVTRTTQYKNNIMAKSKQSTNNGQCLKPGTSVGMQKSDNHATVGSETAQQTINNACMSSQSFHNSNRSTDITRSGSFKRYNSFSGPVVQNSAPVLNRQRSMSGNNGVIQTNMKPNDSKIKTDNQTLCQQVRTSTNVNSCQNKLVDSVPNFSQRNIEQQRKKCHIQQNPAKSDNQKSNNNSLQNYSVSQRNNTSVLKPKAVRGFVAKKEDNLDKDSLKKDHPIRSVCSTLQEGCKPTSLRQIPNKTTASATTLETDVLDTSISDDLLWQLAEPDKILESQAELISATGKLCNNKSKSMVANKVESVKSAEHTNKDLSGKQDSAKQKFTFKHSRKLGNQRNDSKLPVTNTVVQNMDCNRRAANTEEHAVRSGVNINPANKTVTERKVNNQRTVDLVKENPSKDYTYSEDLFSDDDDLLADSEGLTEDQIFAMLDEVEMMATQKIVGPSQSLDVNRQKQSDTAAYKSNQSNLATSKTNKQTGINNNALQPRNCGTEIYHAKDKQESVRDSHNLKSSQEHSSSQGQPSSQGQISQMSSSQAKYSAAEIERKKQMAIERRQKRLRESQIQKS